MHGEQNHFEFSGMVTAALGEKTKPGHKCIFITAEIKTFNNCHIPRGNPVEQEFSSSICCVMALCFSQNCISFKCPLTGYL